MAVEIVMPNMGFDTQAARLVEWLKKPGDSLQKGDIIAIIESDKANVELESIASGVLLEQLYPADTEIEVGKVIARVGQANEKPPPSSVGISPVARRMAQENQVDLNRVVGTGARGRITRDDVAAALQPSTSKILALPKVRQAARQAGVDLRQVTPNGKHGQITFQDLQAFLAVHETDSTREKVPEENSIPVGVREIVLSRKRQHIGKRLGKSKRKAPHFYVTSEFDFEKALAKLPGGVKVNDLLQYLTVQTLLHVPELNATYIQKHLYQHESVDLAIAVAQADGLITPVIRGAERYSLIGLAQESLALIQRARENRLQTNDLQGGSFTMSNLGVIKQVEHFTAVINPPQVAILAIGAVKQRPVVIHGGLHIHHTAHLTLSGDHRVVDGMHLAQFMKQFQAQLDLFNGV